ncbi:MAG TPA: hypothetical protein VI685_28600 [Candidatus Angelobacter sp.]
MSRTVLYVTQGKINLKEPGKRARVIESKFGQSLIDRASQIYNRNAWKVQGTGAKFMSGRMLWAEQDPSAPIVPVAVTGISRGTHEGELLYSLATDEVTGVFALRNQGSDEQRLFHTADFRVSQLNAHPAQDRVACVVQHKGASHIGVMKGDGSELTDVTQGDSVDGAPSWVPGSGDDLIYQSAGIGRNQDGTNAGASSTRIEKLNTATGEMVTLLEDGSQDFLDPRMDAAGNLYCIRKPYRVYTRFNPFRALLDLVLFPFRLLFAFFQYMNFFSVRYTGKTLVTSGDSRQRQADLRQMMMLGNLMQAQREADHLPVLDRQGLVPRSWELVKKAPDGELQVVARGALSFDLCDDGAILYTDGSHIFLLQPDGRKEELLSAQFISQVIAV